MAVNATLKPKHLKVLMDISNKCNLRCKMCHFSFDKVFYRPAQFMTRADFDQIAQQVLPFAHTLVLSAGSEPTTSPHFGDILQSAGEWKLPELKFLTNGILLTENLCAIVLDSGVTQIDVSIDGATPATYERIRRGAKFEKLTRNLRVLRGMKRQRNQSQPLVQFNITLMKTNLSELGKFVDLAEELGVERIGCRHLMPYDGPNIGAESLFHIPMEANQSFKHFVSRIESSLSVQLITFPDFFPAPKPEGTLQYDSIDSIEALLNDATNRATEGMVSPPFGYVDIPAESTVITKGTISLAGWALDAVGIVNVVIASRDLLGGLWKVHRVAKLVNGSRPDIAEKFPNYPGNSGAGWVCDLDITAIGAGKEDSATSIEVLAINRHGLVTSLGVRQVILACDETQLGAIASDSCDPFLFCRKPFNSTY